MGTSNKRCHPSFGARPSVKGSSNLFFPLREIGSNAGALKDEILGRTDTSCRTKDDRYILCRKTPLKAINS
ncbi:MAG: hypothetical protein J6Y91_03145, partial [Alphaproteobacteria bacterium]|nr:hypothetical protein [Alphaproteobacteria bacterium]